MNHPGHGSLSIHPPRESKTRKTKLWAIGPQVWHPLRATQPVTLRRLPISRSRPFLQSVSLEASIFAPPCSPHFARRRRCTQAMAHQKPYVRLQAWSNHRGTQSFYSIRKPMSLETNITGQSFQHFIRGKQRQSKRSMPPMPNALGPS